MDSRADQKIVRLALETGGIWIGAALGAVFVAWGAGYALFAAGRSYGFGEGARLASERVQPEFPWLLLAISVSCVALALGMAFMAGIMRRTRLILVANQQAPYNSPQEPTLYAGPSGRDFARLSGKSRYPDQPRQGDNRSATSSLTQNATPYRSWVA